MWKRKELKKKAKVVLKGCYWRAFVVGLLLSVVGAKSSGKTVNFDWPSSGNEDQISNAGSLGDINVLPDWYYISTMIGIILIAIAVGIALRIFWGYLLEIGGRRFFIKAAESEADIYVVGDYFRRDCYWDIIKAMLWRSIINFLWYLLLIIPGIIKTYAYRMVPYILADNPNIGYKRALELSNEMTKGHKFRIWVLDLSFIGWYILGTLALLVGTLFVKPYDFATNAELYLALRQQAIDSNMVTYGELNLTPPQVEEKMY